MKWSEAPGDDDHTSLFINKLIERLDSILDDINTKVGLTEDELDWVRIDIKGWLKWKSSSCSS